MNEQQLFWADQYAKEYIEKNRTFDLELGKDAWLQMLQCSKSIESILECGCNIGRNLEFLEKVLPNARKSIVEISKPAFDYVTSKYALHHAFNGSIEDSEFPQKFDLVFTMGVLIHVHPGNLLKTMGQIYKHSNRYILIGEYFNRSPVVIKYQGQDNKLFKMDFGKLYLENFEVRVVTYGFLWGHIYDRAGFDDITWWLFEKQHA
jgi:pseudaminic acid biosynthesis-associated methylase